MLLMLLLISFRDKVINIPSLVQNKCLILQNLKNIISLTQNI